MALNIYYNFNFFIYYYSMIILIYSIKMKYFNSLIIYILNYIIFYHFSSLIFNIKFKLWGGNFEKEIWYLNIKKWNLVIEDQLSNPLILERNNIQQIKMVRLSIIFIYCFIKYKIKRKIDNSFIYYLKRNIK